MKYRMIAVSAAPDGSGRSACQRCCFIPGSESCYSVPCVEEERNDKRNVYFVLEPVPEGQGCRTR